MVNSNVTAKSIKSVWLEGANKSSSIADSFGKSLDQIQSQIKEKGLTRIENQFDEFRGSSSALAGFLDGFKSKFNLGLGEFTSDIRDVVSKTVDAAQLKKWAAEGETLLSYGKAGLDTYADFQKGNYGAILDKFGDWGGDGVQSLIGYAKDGTAIYSAVKNTDFSDVNSILDLGKQITGVDLKDALGFNYLESQVTGLLSIAQKYDIPGMIDLIKDQLGDDPAVSTGMISGLTANAQLGQLDTIDKMLDFIDGPTALALDPLLVTRILSHYRYPVGWNGDVEKERKKILRILNKIKPGWDKEVIDGTTYYKEEPWVRCSGHAMMLFQGDPTYGDLAMISRSYPTIELTTLLNRTYRYLNL